MTWFQSSLILEGERGIIAHVASGIESRAVSIQSGTAIRSSGFCSAGDISVTMACRLRGEEVQPKLVLALRKSKSMF